MPTPSTHERVPPGAEEKWFKVGGQSVGLAGLVSAADVLAIVTIVEALIAAGFVGWAVREWTR